MNTSTALSLLNLALMIILAYRELEYILHRRSMREIMGGIKLFSIPWVADVEKRIRKLEEKENERNKPV